MTSEEILFDAEERMEKAVTVFRDELRGLRSKVFRSEMPCERATENPGAGDCKGEGSDC